MANTLAPADQSRTTIYHGTPMTPRDALQSVCAGRAMCVSFYRPDDVEVVEAISPAIMFRQRRVFILAGSSARRSGMGRASGLDAILRLARAEAVRAGPVGSHSRYARSTLPAQRCAPERVAVRSVGSAPVAHGRASRAATPAVRPTRPGLPRVDRSKGRIAGLPCADGGSFHGDRERLAKHSHDARNSGGLRLPVHQRGQHLSRTEWAPL